MCVCVRVCSVIVCSVCMPTATQRVKVQVGLCVTTRSPVRPLPQEDLPVLTMWCTEVPVLVYWVVVTMLCVHVCEHIYACVLVIVCMACIDHCCTILL